MASALENKRNIAILAHVDAGKTTVSERLLYFSDTIAGLGEVDEGLATMDYLEEERKRGITIEAGIASYTWKGVRTTFVDTPGHVDFGVEVDFALQSVEGVILVISGPRGLESQTLEAWEKIQRNRNRPLLFINKLDVPGADFGKVLEQIQILFKVRPVVLTFPVYVDGKIDGVVDVAHQLALFRSMENPRKLIKGDIPAAQAEAYRTFRRELVDFASRFNDAVLETYVQGGEAEAGALLQGVRDGIAQGAGAPVFMGSALKNVGMRQLLNGINQLLPPPTVPDDAEESLGFALKLRWYRGIGKIVLAKVFSPAVTSKLPGTRFFRVFAEHLEEIHAVEAGDIVALQAPQVYPIGRVLRPGAADRTHPKGYLPLLQARLEAAEAADSETLRRALEEISGTDPSIRIEPEAATGGWIIRTVGELQLDVFCKRLKTEHGCNVRVGAPWVRYLEKLKRPATGWIHAAKAFGAEVELELDAIPRTYGDENHILIPEDAGAEEAEVLRDCFKSFCTQGVCGYGEIAALELVVRSLRGSVRPLPLPLLAKAVTDGMRLNLLCAQFEIFEPMMKLEIIAPEEFCGAILSDLAARGGVIRKIDADGRNSVILLEIPLENTFGYTTLLRSLSKGLGVFVLTYEKHGVKRRD